MKEKPPKFADACGFPLKMVQRKVGNKHGIQADHVHKLGNPKPALSQLQDGRNRVADMKKKMKKSRSFKLSDIESFRSSAVQPVKLNPISAQPAAAKQSMIRASDGSPNYMKSTTSSVARKERSKVSPRYHSKVSPGSNHKTARTSSLKLVKTLTKSPSFKPVRASTKKCSKVALCADMGSHRATCSSTLKDSKFPEYLMLNPGGTEYEGTSVIKVCPYTYCSLNGHRHAPLPPLKCFLSARRRAMKTQKSTKLEALSPRRATPSSDALKAIDTGQVAIDEKPADQEVSVDFFIEIYAKSRDDAAESCDDDKFIVLEATERDDEEPVSEIDSEGNLGKSSDIVFSETSSNGDQREEVADEDYPPFLAPGEITPGYTSDGWESKSEATDMDWEEGQLVAPIFYNSTQGNEEVDLEIGYLLEIKHPDLQDEPTSRPDGMSAECFEEVIKDESSCFEVEFGESDSEFDGIDHNLEIDEISQLSESPSEDQVSSIKEEFEKAATAGEDGNAKMIDIASSPMEETNDEKCRVSEAESLKMEKYLQLEDDETAFVIDTPDEKTMDQQESGSFNDDDDDAMQLENPVSDTSQDFAVTEQDETDEGGGDNTIEVHQSDTATDVEGNGLSEKAFDETLLLKTEDSETDQNVNTRELILPQEFADACAGDGKEEEEQVGDFVEDGKSSEADESQPDENPDQPYEKQSEISNIIEDQIDLDNDQAQGGKFKISNPMDPREQSDSEKKKSSSAEDIAGETNKMEVEDRTEPEAAESDLNSKNTTSTETRTAFFPAGSNTNQEPDTACNNSRGIRGKRPVGDSEEERKFNPREPNYLPLEPDPEAERVDLRHQMMDERKNSEEWMLDFALRKAVTELAPARKRKVALLVEAFETVLPLPKFETRIRHTSAAFDRPRPIQACS